jgi:hypothetical protein
MAHNVMKVNWRNKGQEEKARRRKFEKEFRREKKERREREKVEWLCVKIECFMGVCVVNELLWEMSKGHLKS